MENFNFFPKSPEKPESKSKFFRNLKFAGLLIAGLSASKVEAQDHYKISDLSRSDKFKKEIRKSAQNILDKGPLHMDETYQIPESYLEAVKDNFPEDYAKTQLESQNSIDTAAYKKLVEDEIQSLKDGIEVYTYNLKSMKDNPEKHKDPFKVYTKEDLKNKTIDQESIDLMTNYYSEEIIKNQALIDTLENSPIENFLPEHKTYEEWLKEGENIQTHAKKSMETLKNRRELLGSTDQLVDKIDKERMWLFSVMHSPEYKKRLEEYEGLSANDLSKRIEQVRKFDYNISLDYTDVSRTDSEGNISFEATDASIRPQGMHEYQHLATKAHENMSEYAKNLYAESLDKEAMNKDYGDKVLLDSSPAFSHPSEVDARKKVFEYDLDRLGIKKYSEEFTDEHYQKAMELMKGGKLSDNSIQFLRMIKPDFVKKIMNTIALSEEGNEDGAKAV